jgi:hypothetical protein
MLINILLTIVGIFLLISFEGFLTSLFSFSAVFVALLFLLDKVRWEIWLILAFVVTLFVDILLQRALGTTLLVTSVSSTVLYLLFLIIPQKQVILSYIPYLISTLLFYILLDLFTPFLQDRVWGTLTWQGLLHDLTRSVVTVGIIFVVNTVISNFRSHDTLTL